VNLTVTGPGGSNSKLRTNYISVSTPPEPPVANFTGAPTSGDNPLTVQFTDQSTGSITSYSWDFGDTGTSTLANPEHTYSSAGTYSVNLTVAGPGGSNSRLRTNYITVSTPPEFFADFTVSPVAGIAPLTVQCTDRSVGEPTRYYYDFGDGTGMAGPNPVHTYRFPGTYTVTLTITKFNSTTQSVMTSTSTKTNVVTVGRVPFVRPVAKFTASPTQGAAPLTVTFTDMSTGSPTFSAYDFGDGTTMTGPNAVHTYWFPGVYNVTLTVTKFDRYSGSIIASASVQKDLIVVSGG
jgi:PKD repeat protein